MRIIVSIITLAPLLNGAAHAASPAEVCAAAKTKAAGAAVFAKAKCHQAALAKMTAVDPTCLAKADQKLAGAFAAAEAKGGCATTGDGPALAGFVNGCITTYTNAITGDPRCAGGKTKATGKNTLDDANCAKKATIKGTPVDPACTGKASAKLTAAFSKADKKGVCTGTAPEMLAIIDDCVAEIVVPDVTTTTTSTTSTTTTTTLPLQCDFQTSDQCITVLATQSPNLATCFNNWVNFYCVVPCGEDCPDPVACGQCLRSFAPAATDACCP